jgi:agmatine deiminase
MSSTTSTGTRPGTHTGMLMPAESAQHARTWMELPAPDLDSRPGFGAEGSPSLVRSQLAWAGVANALAGFEPVTVLVPPGYERSARRMLVSGVRIHQAPPDNEIPKDNAWLRARGPTFVHAADGSVRAVNWAFSGWGSAHFASWDAEPRVARAVADIAKVPVLDSPLALEGGALQVDGEGTALLAESVALDPNRNPGWTHQRVEAELAARLGVTTVIWLPGGLRGDHGEWGPQGHVDMLACFARPGVALVHDQSDPGHPDHAVSRATTELLRGATDARGRRLTVIPLPAPSATRSTGFGSTHSYVNHSYVNHYVANDVVLLGVFDDPADQLAGQILRRVYRGREILMLDATPIFAAGGGIHSITQQQPAPADTSPPSVRPRPAGLTAARLRQGGLTAAESE